jgi:hypothetical protein
VDRVSRLCEVSIELAEQGEPAVAAGALQQAKSVADGIRNRAARDYLYEEIGVAQAKTSRPKDGWMLARRIEDKLQRRDAVKQVAAAWARTVGQEPNALAFAGREPDRVLRLYGLVGIVMAHR